MKDWFEGLESRERMFVAAAGVCIVFAIYWFGLWMPLERGERELSASIEDWQTSLAELRPLKGRIDSRTAASAATRQNQSLVVIVDNTLRARAMLGSMQRSQPTNDNGIRVEFENVAFDELVLWLGDLGTQFGLHVQTASFSRASGSAPGRINASLTLERA
ncbi:MAG: type II secretion system protein M [Woeseiaceae bacterium]|nr:type II secretion system protein M [Woeseiaceae bacterium]